MTDTSEWTPEELAELAAAEAAERSETVFNEVAPATNAGASDENQGNSIDGDEATKRSSPTYGVLDTADDFPVQEKAKHGGGGPSKKLKKQLQVLVDEPALHGKAVKIIEFTTPNGAKTAIDDVMSGKREVPDGVWVLKALRVNDAQGKRVSHLWAVYQGPLEDGGSDVTDATEGSKANAEVVEAEQAAGE